MRILASILALLAILASAAVGIEEAEAAATPACHDYETLVAALNKRYGEEPVSLGMQNNGHALQVFASALGDSWTVLSIAPNGTGCIVAAGHHWQTREPGPTDPAA